jgi:hypothetical protein
MWSSEGPDAKPQDLQRRSADLSECSLHWLVVNIEDCPKCDYNNWKGNVLFDYMKPSPPLGSGVHHYIFALYEQLTKWDDMSIENLRRVIPISVLLRKFGLKNTPVYSSVFMSEYEKGGGKSRKNLRKRKRYKSFGKIYTSATKKRRVKRSNLDQTQ